MDIASRLDIPAQNSVVAALHEETGHKAVAATILGICSVRGLSGKAHSMAAGFAEEA